MNTSGYLCIDGLIIKEVILRELLRDKLLGYLNGLTIKCINNQGNIIKTPMYDTILMNGVKYTRLPRTEISNLIDMGLTGINIILPKLRPIQCNLINDLHDNQAIVVDKLVDTVFTKDRINNGTATCILNMKAGTGKTFVACGLINAVKLQTIYIVPKVPLLEQAIKDMTLMFGDNIAGKYNSGISYPITVCVINTALTIPNDIRKTYSLVILDEVHSYCSPKRRDIFRKFTSPLVFGMSATTEDRKDKLDEIMVRQLVFDDIIRTDTLFIDDTTFKTTAKIIKYYGKDEYTDNLTHENTGKIFTHYMHNQYISDPDRLELITNELLELYDWRDTHSNMHYIYIFAEELDILRKMMTYFLDKLRSLNRTDISVSSPEVDMFVGGTSKDEIERMIANSRVLLTTYGYAGTGISINKMSAIIFLTPRRANMKQIIARILRKGSNVDIPRIVIDIVDHKTALRHQVNDRILAYKFYNFDIKVTKFRADY